MSALAVFVHVLRSLLSFVSRLVWPEDPTPQVRGSGEVERHVQRRYQIATRSSGTHTDNVGRAQNPRTRPASIPLPPPASVAHPAVSLQTTLDPAAVNVTGQIVEGTKVIERLLLQIVAAASPSDVLVPTGGIVERRVQRRDHIATRSSGTHTDNVGRAQNPRTRPFSTPLPPPATPPAVRGVAHLSMLPQTTLDPAAVNVTGQIVEGTKVIERLLLQIVAAASPSDVLVPTGGTANTFGYLMEQTKSIVKQHQRKVKRPALFKMLARVRDIRNHAVHTHGSTEPAEVDLPEFLNCFNACHRGLSDILGLLVKQGST